jgi:hypothetical protein
MRYMAKLDRVSSRLDERSTPVGAELRGPRALETAD